MTKKKKISQDSMIKGLIRDYPEDALEFFNPDIYNKYGHPTKINFHIQENKKYSYYDSKIINDIVVIYEFDEGKKLVLTLVEHWSDKSKFDIHRFAHYLIDLDCQFPGYEKFPVALFTDESKKWHKKIHSEIIIKCLDEIFLTFRFRLIRMKSYEAEKYRNTKNRFIAVLRSAMLWDKSKKILLAVDFINNYSDIEKKIKNVIKNIDIIEYYLNINDIEKKRITEILEGRRNSNMIVQELLKKGKLEGLIEGEIKGKLKGAKKMFEKGFGIEDILEITELSKKDLVKAGIIKDY